MVTKARLLLALIFALAWASQTVYLVPLPSERIDDFVELHSRAFDSGTAATIPGESKPTYLTRIRSSVYAEFWAQWAISLILILFGLFAAMAMLKEWRASVLLMTISSLCYVISWAYFNGLFGSGFSLSEFASMWRFATAGHSQLIFLHRSILLLGLFILFAFWGLVALRPGSRGKE